MEFLQTEARTHIALATVSAADQKAVYQSTTVPITNGSGIPSTGNGRIGSHLPVIEITANDVSSAAGASTAPASAQPSENGGFRFAHITSLPAREPLDIQFKDVSYTASLGYFRGESR